MQAHGLGPAMGRRVLLSGALGLVGMSVLASCTAQGASSDSAAVDEDGVAKVDFWGWVPGLEDMVATWNSANADVQVSFHRMTGDDGAKVKAAVDAGAGPDLVQLSSHDLPEYVIAGRVQDISEYTEGVAEKFTESSWSQVRFNDGVYGVPQGIGPAGMMYREDLFAQYGIEVPETWDDYVAAARTLHAANPEVYIAGFSPTEIGQWMQEVWQAEGSWFGIDGDQWIVSVNSPESKLVAERWQLLLDEGLVKVTQMWTPDYWADIAAGRIATVSYAAWFPNLLAENVGDTAGKWKIAPLPVNAGSTAAGESGGAAVVALKGAKNLEASARFAVWLNSADENQDTLITVGGLFPSTVVGLASPALEQPQPFFGGQVTSEVFVEAAKNTPSTWVDGPAFSSVQTGITDGFSLVATGSTTFVEVLDEVQADTIATMESSGLNVKGA
ncbi:extracellular solute-binding protein [Rathayibacter sp. ZW T2_19]|uniref:Extracellular solute-binding protein n=1 Tax=Rathayibacter rubneri TaxID=2950106 RepID=A0A9X2DU61_9MICO|nr:extracellular solute-binding protein [Rathayibacter rubneri]MCM6761205.1 extracellular solute-binding protein [Rathayibacter rubneri]